VGKCVLGTSTSTLSDVMNKKDFRLEVANSKPLMEDIFKQLEIVNETLNNIGEDLKTAAEEKYITGEFITQFIGWSNKCFSQASAAERVRTDLNYRYCDDIKKYSIQKLDERISILEKKLEVMESK